MSFDNVKDWLSEITLSMRERYGDVFISYFVGFEIIYNWKFFYTLISGGDPKNVATTVDNAERFLQVPFGFQLIQDLLGSPSNFCLAIISAMFMSVIYPLLSSGIIMIRKIALYYSNMLLQSGFASNAEYLSLKKICDEQAKRINDFGTQKLGELGLLSRYLWSESVFKYRSSTELLFSMPRTGSKFELDEIYLIEHSDNCLMAKFDFKNIQRDRIGIVLESVNNNIYLCSRGANRTIPITQKMVNSGKTFYGFLKSGKATYFDDLDEKLNKDLFLSAHIKGVGEISEVRFHS